MSGEQFVHIGSKNDLLRMATVIDMPFHIKTFQPVTPCIWFGWGGLWGWRTKSFTFVLHMVCLNLSMSRL